MVATTTTVRDGEAQHLIRGAVPLLELDLRYLRKALRHRFHQAGVTELGTRPSPVSRHIGGGYIGRHRAERLERLADWIVQAEA